MHVGSKESGMGMEEENINAAVSNEGSNKNAFFFVSEERSRKRPKIETPDNDSFLLDDIIEGFRKSIKAPGANQFKPSIPDLNSSMGGSVNEIIRERREKESDLIAKPSGIGGSEKATWIREIKKRYVI
ncbi:hypothetical protein L1987_18769 [Smallanthus sonchifolius]|uniref:Uncharacterized protein n=1 Tax=Smallanthus sonchifolius TaxID=185202 RepID=A0ACB9J0Z7_9ASTR|nr:hypothetical protein L1987_18769 [Smallanthus sonchifolius]